ncbi:MAG: hypothetical protein EZS28_047751, partial [Streblomastix strix]
MEELYQFAQSLGKTHHASDYDVFKIFEALVDDKELDDEQKQFYEQKKLEYNDSRFYSVSIVVLIKSSSSQFVFANSVKSYLSAWRIVDPHGGTDPSVIVLALQYILVPLLQNPPIGSVLLTPHKIGLPAEQLTDPLVAPLVAPVPAITDPLKDNVFPSV